MLEALMAAVPGSWTAFTLGSWGAWAAVVALALARRGKPFAAYAGVTLGLHSLVSSALWPVFRDLSPGGLPAWPLVVGLQVAAFLHTASLCFPRLRPTWWRVLVTWPGLWWGAANLLAAPWAVVLAAGLVPHGWFLPYLVGLAGLVQSLRSEEETEDIVLDGAEVDGLRRLEAVGSRVDRPLKIVQITDPHLGPFMSVERLRGICERAVALDPDLVLLTGDYLTMESKGTPGCLAEALAPLRALEGRTYACLGNHDLEAPRMVARELAEVGVRLLVDEAVTVQTEAGPVQIVGFDFRWRGRAEQAERVAARWPREDGALRVVLLHDPSAFAHIADGDADLVLSGHTHGGQLGLLSLGLPHTVVGAIFRVPDHGLWGKGRNRLYVHRATGHYGFPLRLGVPAQQGLIRVHAVD